MRLINSIVSHVMDEARFGTPKLSFLSCIQQSMYTRIQRTIDNEVHFPIIISRFRLDEEDF